MKVGLVFSARWTEPFTGGDFGEAGGEAVKVEFTCVAVIADEEGRVVVVDGAD